MKNNEEYDENIISALHKIKFPLITKNGIKVILDIRSRNETIYEHIANKKNHLTIRDIELIKEIIVNPKIIVHSKRNKNYIAIYGDRKIKNKKTLIKIILDGRDCAVWKIRTLYPVKKISEKT